MKKKVIILILILVLVVCAVLIGMYFMEKPSSDLLMKYIENGKIDELTLTIYYADFYLPSVPVSQKQLIEHVEKGTQDMYKVIVSGKELINYKDTLCKIAQTKTEKCSSAFLATLVYYRIDNFFGKKVFDVAMWGYNKESLSMVVNGVEVKYDAIFEEIVTPFLIPNTSPFEV